MGNFLSTETNIDSHHLKQKKNVEGLNDATIKAFREDYFRCIFYGGTKSGKTYLLLNSVLPSIIDQYDNVFIFTKKDNKTEYEHAMKAMGLPETHYKMVFSQYILQLKRIRMLQEINVNEQLSQKKGKTVFNTNILVIWDDVLDEKLFNEPDFLDQFTNFRHLQISVILLSQITTKILNPRIKSNVKFYIFFRINDAHQRRECISILEGCILKANDRKSITTNAKFEADDLYRSVIGLGKWGHIVCDETGEILHITDQLKKENNTQKDQINTTESNDKPKSNTSNDMSDCNSVIDTTKLEKKVSIIPQPK